MGESVKKANFIFVNSAKSKIRFTLFETVQKPEFIEENAKIPLLASLVSPLLRGNKGDLSLLSNIIQMNATWYESVQKL